MSNTRIAYLFLAAGVAYVVIRAWQTWNELGGTFTAGKITTTAGGVPGAAVAGPG